MFFSVLAAVAMAGNADNRLPSDALDALHSAQSGVLYSIEPWSEPSPQQRQFHGYVLLGKTEVKDEVFRIAAEEFEAAVERSDNVVAACFDPRHALTVSSAQHEYEFLLCYACHQIAVYRDGVHITTLGASGSAKVLNGLLVAKAVPVSTSYDEDAALARMEEGERDAARWQDTMPMSLRPLWNWHITWSDIELKTQMRTALEQEFPVASQRILALYRWYGSGSGPWSGFPEYESVAEYLLLTHSTEELLASLDSAELTEAQLEGAARLFGSWTFSEERPNDRVRIPATRKAQFLAHAMKSDDEDKRDRAEHAFRN